MTASEDGAALDATDAELPHEPVDTLTDEESEDLVEAEPSGRNSIAYSGQDFDVDGLVRRLDEGNIVIPTFGQDDPSIATAGFQRSFVWNRKQMDRFIESLLLGYPVPGIFLVRQADRRYLVLDGQQRLRTLQAFKAGVHAGKEFVLTNVATQFKGLTYRTLDEQQRRLMNDAFITATIVATDGSSSSLESVYQVFERLNAGGTQLTPHEIRVALYAGPFIDFLERLNSRPEWRQIYGERKSPRLRDQELVLRILALSEDSKNYKRPLKAFLNDFVAKHRSLNELDWASIENAFIRASSEIAPQASDGRLRWRDKAVNSAWIEAVMVGAMRRVQKPTPLDHAKIDAALASLRGNPIMAQAVTRSTADEEQVKSRLKWATEALSEV